MLLNIVCVPSVADPIEATEPFGFDAVPALKNASDNASSVPNEPVPQVITVATGSIKAHEAAIVAGTINKKGWFA